MLSLKTVMISGQEVHPLIEGGKGIAVSNGQSSGAWANASGVGTFSAVNADTYDDEGNVIPITYKGKTRRERHVELIANAIEGGITQAKIAHESSNGKGRIHMNVLWEMGAVEPILHGVLEKTKGMVHGVTCGAGMPYKLAEICVSYGLYYYPIVSSARAFNILWKRAYHHFPEFLGAVVYEDPWLAGGHNGLSNSEDPNTPLPPYERVKALRAIMRENHISDATPIIMAGGVWWLSEWQEWLDNPDLGAIAFQFGTRPLLTKESPISDAWKKRLITLEHGDIFLNRFSPTGFYSSAVNNKFIQMLQSRSERQVAYAMEPLGDHDADFPVGSRGRLVYLTAHDKIKAQEWVSQGYTQAMRTPDSTLVFVTPPEENEILTDQINCMGCLSHCNFSNWAQNEAGTTGHKADPRSFCIQKTLQAISHSDDIDNQLMFSGHQAYRFGSDPFYANGNVPTVAQLIERILTGY